MKVIDISRPLFRGMPVYPGDPEVVIEQVRSLKKDGCNLSGISMGLHSGTHIDAPIHYLPNGGSIDETPLEALTGNACVCDLSHAKGGAGAKDLRPFRIRRGDIVLLKTGDKEQSPVFLEADGAEHLLKKGAKAVGIDRLSIEKEGDAQVHMLLLGRGVPIIEGLLLSHVSAGRYMTCCAPLKIKGAEAGPARCVLIRYSAKRSIAPKSGR